MLTVAGNSTTILGPERAGDFSVNWETRQFVLAGSASHQRPVTPFALQPIVQLRDQSVFAHEMLYRGPAIQNGDWCDVDIAMIECFAAQHISDKVIFLNVSHQALVAVPAQAFIDASRKNNLYFELSEAVTDRATLLATTDKVNELSTNGVRFAVDDFGNGADGYKRVFALDKVSVIKIDGDLLSAAYHRKHAAKMLHAMVIHWNSQGITTIAECIEDDRLMEFAQSLEFDMGQGFFIDKMVSSKAAYS
jgi:EAL domain-containing protein (putative c-di-GMP-specific phosphodiesterase class I)